MNTRLMFFEFIYQSISQEGGDGSAHIVTTLKNVDELVAQFKAFMDNKEEDYTYNDRGGVHVFSFYHQSSISFECYETAISKTRHPFDSIYYEGWL